MSFLLAEIERLENEIASDEAIRKRSMDKGMMSLSKGGHYNREPYHESTFLYIKALPEDSGDRPLIPGSVFWNSPDIELYEGNTLIATNEIREGVSYTVQVVVTNGGDYASTACTVDLFICNPSLALNIANAKMLGVQATEVNTHSTATLTFNFTATGEDVGHRCLFARAYSPITKDLPLTADEFDTPNDRHVAQQNLSVVKQDQVFMLEFMPLITGLGTIQIKRQPAMIGRISKFRVAKRFRIRESVVDEKFEVLHAPELAVTTKTLQKLIDLKIQGTRKPKTKPETLLAVQKSETGKTLKSARLIKQGTRISLSKIATGLHPIKKIRSGQWALPSMSNTDHRPVTAVINIPPLQLKPREAAIYTIEMRDANNQVYGGITLLITG